MRVPFLIAVMSLLLPAPAFADGVAPQGWSFEYPPALPYFDFGVEKVAGARGEQSAFLRARGTVPVSGGLIQRFSARDYAGRRVRLSGNLRTEDAKDAALFVTVSRDGQVLDSRQSIARPNSGWTPFQVALDVPADATLIKIGVVLRGKGTVWADTLSFETVGAGPRSISPIAAFDLKWCNPGTNVCSSHGGMSRLEGH